MWRSQALIGYISLKKLIKISDGHANNSVPSSPALPASFPKEKMMSGKANRNFLKKIPKNAETANILVTKHNILLQI